ncbi:MAG: protein kinase domain-containing protein [Nannocystales bacterium]
MIDEDQPPEHPSLSDALLAEDPNEAAGRNVEREQALAEVHARMFGSMGPVCLGRFELGARRGAGAMGVVYEALDPDLDRKVALKVLRSTALDPHGAERFAHEARALAKLRHRNVVTVYEVGTDGDDRFIVMDLVQGETLREWMEARHSLGDIVRMFIGAGEGLQAAHDAGLVHRDFKPDNVLVEDELPRVVDFGLAAGTEDARVTMTQSDEDEPIEPVEPARYTQTGAFVGTPVYMAPEQARGQADPAADQYAFCVSLFEAIEGRRPHADAESEGFEAMLSAREAPVQAGTPAAAPRWLRAAIARGLAPNPADRWPSMNQLLAVLRRIDGGGRRRTAIAVAGVGLTATAAGLGSQWSPIIAATSDPCADAGSEIAEVWSDSRRATLQQRFLGTKLTYAADTWERVAPRLDTYAKQWTEVAQRACLADLAAPVPAPPLNQARLRCIGRRRSDFVALLDTFAAPTAKTVDRAVDAADTIPPLATCDEAALVREQLERGQEREQAPSTLYGQLAASDVAFRTGDDEVARSKAQVALEGANAVPDHELAALAALVLARVHRRSGDLEEAVSMAGNAIDSAERLGDTRLRVKARLELLRLFVERREFDAGLREARFIRASLGHLADPPGLLSDFELVEGWLFLYKGDMEPALQRFEAAEAHARAQGPGGSARVGRSLSAQGKALGELGRYEESVTATRSAVELLTGRLGGATPSTIRARLGLVVSMCNLGLVQDGVVEATAAVVDADAVQGKNSVLAARARATLGIAYSTTDLQESVSLLREAAEVLEGVYGLKNPDSATAWLNLAHVLSDVDPQEAVDVLDHVAEIYASTLPTTHPDYVYLYANLAEGHAKLENWEAATVAAQRAESLAQQHFPGDNGRLARIRTLRGSAMRGGGDPDGATALLESVLLARRKAESQPALIADTQYELALSVADQGNIEQATAYMEAARATFRKQNAHEHRAKLIDAWLADH